MPAHLLLRIAAWLLVLPWIAKLIEAARGLPRVPNLLISAYDLHPANNPALTVVVPARNEAAAIHQCLQSLLDQDYPNLQILAVNDRSTDSTGAIMDSLAKAHPTRLRALHITELPPNWLGKPHAMAVAARTAIAGQVFGGPVPDFLLFTDGDILFASSILRRALAQAQATGADHFITLPTTLTHTPGESMLLAFLQTLSLFAVRPWCTESRSERDAIGVGAFNMLRTSAYTQLGGFESMPAEVLEDLTLGRRIRAAGLRQRIAYAPGAVAVHWAPGLVGVLHGMTKNLFAVFRFRPALLLAGAAGLALFCITPWLLLLLPTTLLPEARIVAVLFIASVAGLYWLVSRRSLISPIWFLSEPVAATLLIYSMLRSMFITLRDGGITWRGTFYPLQTIKR